MNHDVSDVIRRHIEENFLFRGDGGALRDTDSLIEAGLIDSTGVLELVAFLEGRFGIAVGDADIVPQHFDSIAGLAAYVRARSGAEVAGHAD